MYRIAKLVFGIILRMTYRIEVKGSANIPTSGAVMFCANHVSNLDPIVLGISSPRCVRYMAKDELFHIPILSQLIRSFGAFPVHRGQFDRNVLKFGLSVLEEGRVLGVFPEGTRSKTGQLGKALNGSAYFALRTNTPVLPVAICGDYRLFSKVSVTFGPVVDLLGLSVRDTHEAMVRIMEQIQTIIDAYSE